jgi:hypothetical protein
MRFRPGHSLRVGFNNSRSTVKSDLANLSSGWTIGPQHFHDGPGEALLAFAEAVGAVFGPAERGVSAGPPRYCPFKPGNSTAHVRLIAHMVRGAFGIGPGDWAAILPRANAFVARLPAP